MPSSPDIPRTHILSYVATATDSPTNVRRTAAAATATAWTSWAYLYLLLLALSALFLNCVDRCYYSFYFMGDRYVSELYDRTIAYNPTALAALSAVTLLLLLTRFLRRSYRPRLMTALTFFAAVPLIGLLFAHITGPHVLSVWNLLSIIPRLDLLEGMLRYIDGNLFSILVVASIFLLFCTTRLTARPIRRERPGASLLAFAALLPTTLLTLTLAALTAAFALAHGLGFLPVAYPAPLALLWLLPAALAAFLTLLTDILRFLLWITRNPLAEKTTTHFLPTRTAPIAHPPTMPTSP
jgi:hypothetical protein